MAFERNRIRGCRALADRDGSRRDPGSGGDRGAILARGYAFVVVSLRYLIVGGWAAVVVLAIMFLPPLSANSAGGPVAPGPAGLGGRPRGNRRGPAVRLPHRRGRGDRGSVTRTVMPMATRTGRSAGPLAVTRGCPVSPGQLAQLATAAAALAKAGLLDAARSCAARRARGRRVASPGWPERSRCPTAGPAARDEGAVHHGHHVPVLPAGDVVRGADGGRERYVHWSLSRPADHVIGVTGPVPADYEQSQIIGRYILWVELFTVLAIALIVGLRFRSVGAPLATLACAATAYVLAVRVVVWLARRMGVTLPPDLDPVLVVLLLGVTTDYAVFFLDGMRARIAGGGPRVRAAGSPRRSSRRSS